MVSLNLLLKNKSQMNNGIYNIGIFQASKVYYICGKREREGERKTERERTYDSLFVQFLPDLFL